MATVRGYARSGYPKPCLPAGRVSQHTGTGDSPAGRTITTASWPGPGTATACRPIIAGRIVRLYIENHSVQQLLDAGLDADWVRRVTRMIDRNEFKRRQAAPGPRMSKRGFGLERRMPMSGRL